MSLKLWPVRLRFPTLLLAMAMLAAAVSLPAGPAIPASQTVTLTGWFQVAYGDTPGTHGGPGHIEVTRFELVDDQGQSYDLAFDPAVLAAAGGQRALNRRRVTLTGDLTSATPPLVVVRAIQVVSPPAGVAASAGLDSVQAVSGPQPWVTILCKFSDWPSYDPHPVSYYQGLVGNGHPGLNHFWQEVSYSQINITGSIVLGWFVLPQPRSSYFVGSSFDLNKAFNDCTAQANASVHFPDFVGINLMFNRNLDGFSWGGTRFASLDGVAKIYSTTWIAETHQAHQYVLAHEMGHGFGLPHSSGPYSTPYDSEWDPMSNGGTCSPVHPVYTCLGVHTISHHKDILGWISPSRQVTIPPGSGQTVVLERLGLPASSTSLLLARIPIGGAATDFYTVEARRFAGYDTQVPGEGIVIHKVDTTLSDREARVVDPDGNGNPNDAAAIWLPGETFTDAAHEIVVRVDAATATGYQVTIENAQDAEDTPGALALGSPAFSVSEGVGTATITVARSGGTAGGVTVAYATSNGTAIAGTDYTQTIGTLSFGAGQTTRSFSVPIANDTLTNGNRVFHVTLSDPSSGASLGSPITAPVTILDNEAALRFSSATYGATEGTVATITVTRQGTTSTAVTVPYATSNGTAVAGTHYTAASGTLSFGAGATSRSFQVPTTSNTVADGSRTVNLTLASPGGAGALLGSPSTAVLTIANDDVAGAVQFSAAAYTVSEGASSATITVTRAGGAASNVTVQYATSNGTAGASDYTGSSGTLSFGAAVTSRTFSVPITSDTLAEGPETVLLTLSNPGGGASLGSPKTATLTIADNDPAGTLKLSQATYTVGEAAGTATISVSRSGGTAGGVSVRYATSNGTAVAGTAYTASTGTLSFASGQTTRSFTVPITNDALINGNRTFTVTLSSPSPGASLGSPTTATVTIVDNEGALRFRSSTYSVVEGQSATITVTRQGSTSSAATVRYATSNGSAVAGTHYTARAGTLSFGTGVASRTFTVLTRNDAVVNGSRTVNLTLSNPVGTGAVLGSPSTAVLTITDNDGGSAPPPPSPPGGKRR